MEDKSEIFVKAVHVHPHTGHVTLHVQTRTTRDGATWTGREAAYGVDALIYRHRFNCDREQLAQYVANQHRVNEGVHQELVEHLTGLEGKVIG